MQRTFPTLPATIDKALAILGIKNFFLGIHDASFPGLPEEDPGRGSPYSEGAALFLQFARSLGFNGIQLGPQGITTPANPSPYDSTFFSKNPLSLAPLALTRPPWNLLDPELPARIIGRPPDRCRVDEQAGRRAMEQLTVNLCQQIRRGRGGASASLHRAMAQFRRHQAAWLERDALYEVLRHAYGGRNWRQWGDSDTARLDKHLFNPPAGCEAPARKRIKTLRARHAEEIEDYCFIQYLLAEQHATMRQQCRRLGLRLFGDCQIGLSGRDAWFAQSFLLPDYTMGAPPSRTNPAGQPWNYPVLDPRQYFCQDEAGVQQPGPAVRFLQARMQKLFAEFDGLRLDHPHGLVCPWVYRTGRPDPVRAVQQGARLFASPTLADHPELAQFAIVRPEQINPQVARYDDNWVTDLDADQVHRYGLLFDVVMAEASRQDGREIACEILSTQPYQIKRVMELYGLGRFRVTQKADLNNAADVYRSENGRPDDWLMLGNHDTPSIWQVAAGWRQTGMSRQQAEYLAERLRIPEQERTPWLNRLAADTGALVQAKFADLFVGPAGNIMVFFTDLLGGSQPYNKPGTVSGSNWSLRVDPDYQQLYFDRVGRGLALNIPGALAAALRARGAAFSREHRPLILELEKFSCRKK